MNSQTGTVVKIGIKKVESVLWEFNLEVGSNTVTCRGGYKDDYANWMSRCPELGSPHPEIPALLLKSINGKREEGDLIFVSLGYECTSPEAEYPGRRAGKIKRYSLEAYAGEENLLTFYKLNDLIDESKDALNGLMSSSRTKNDFAAAIAAIGSDPMALFAVEKIRKGIDSYRHAGLVWVERFVTKDLSDMQIEKFHKIDPAVPGNPPGLVDGANWLCIPGTAQPHDDGETWEVERRWQASLPGGWDEWIYGTETPAPE